MRPIFFEILGEPERKIGETRPTFDDLHGPHEAPSPVKPLQNPAICGSAWLIKFGGSKLRSEGCSCPLSQSQDLCVAQII